ncbi:MAG TPA: class I SAM-dependent methyltransferase [Bacilli bacterium]|nr:class I SAM-dependent methyltransferase [Bacilli bacterium]
MKGIYIGNNRVLVNTVWGGLLIVPSDDLSISPMLINTGVFETPLTNFMIKNVKKDDKVFDIGANMGYFSILLAMLVGESGSVVSFEANPTMFHFLKDNISTNYLKLQSKAINKAVYSAHDNLTFYVTERFPANASLYQRGEDYLEHYVDNINEIKVETVTIDSFIDTYDNIDMIKMDIEGGEYHAFLGMEGMLKAGKVNTVVFEWNQDMLRENTILLFEFLKDLRDTCGMTFYILDNQGDTVPVPLEMLLDHTFIPSVVIRKPSSPPFQINNESECKKQEQEEKRTVSETNATPCPICGSIEITTFQSYERFTLLSCGVCDLVFQNQLNQVQVHQLVEEIYDANWVAMRERFVQNTFLEHAQFNSMLLNMFSNQKGDLLEIGSGTGEFLFMARASGWNVAGIEGSSTSCTYALDKYNLDINNELWDISLVPDDIRFDAVAFWHVLEHIPNPKQFLKEVGSVLKPNGIILFSIPNMNSFTNAIHGPYSPLFTEVDHLFHYSEGNLRLLLEKAGLEIITLFSREEQNRLVNDIEASQQHSTEFANLSFEQMMATMANLQGNFEGHELFCVARPKL